MARTVADLTMLFEVMAGEDAGDPCAAPVPVRKVNREDLQQIRIGYFEDDGRTPVTAETRAAVRKSTEALKHAGFIVEPFRPDGLEQARQLWWQFFGIAGGMLLRPMTQEHQTELSPLFKEFLGWAAAEPAHTGQSLLDAWCQRDEVRGQVLKEMEAFPILLCPAAAVPAFRHGERGWLIEGKTVKYLDAWSYTEWFNLLGNPAAVVPVGHSSDGLPIGVQLVGRPWDEEVVLAVAKELELECGGFRTPPGEFGIGDKKS
jgi:Asp-tRNA(Asn)/Glu-tRNA(Gln) amidotransferase A subunit family amidase